MDELPPADIESRRALLQQLTARPPPVEQWEVGGNTNFLIAASRLGLRAASVGHLVSGSQAGAASRVQQSAESAGPGRRQR